MQNYNFIDTRPLCQPLCKIDLSRLDGDRNQCNSLKLNKTTGEIQSSGLSLFHKQGTLAISKRGGEKNEYYRRSIRPFAFQNFFELCYSGLTTVPLTEQIHFNPLPESGPCNVEVTRTRICICIFIFLLLFA